jgi:hypothetical protein
MAETLTPQQQKLAAIREALEATHIGAAPAQSSTVHRLDAPADAHAAAAQHAARTSGGIDAQPIPLPEGMPGMTQALWDGFDRATQLAIHNEFSKTSPPPVPPPVAAPAPIPPPVPGQVPPAGQPLFSQQTAPINPPDMLGGAVPPAPPPAPPAPPPTAEPRKRGRPARAATAPAPTAPELAPEPRVAVALERIAEALETLTMLYSSGR